MLSHGRQSFCKIFFCPPDRITLLALVNFCHVNVSRLGDLPSRSKALRHLK